MIAHVKARYENGVLTPLEPLDLEEGAEVTVSVEEAPPQANGKETPAPKQGLAAIVERVKERQRDIPPDEWKDVPADLAKNHKHYLYGHPKEED